MVKAHDGPERRDQRIHQQNKRERMERTRRAVTHRAANPSTTDAAPKAEQPAIEVVGIQQTVTLPKVAIKTVVDSLKGQAAAGDRVATEIAVEKMAGPLAKNLRIANSAKEHVRAMLKNGSNAVPDARLSEAEALEMNTFVTLYPVTKIGVLAMENKIGNRKEVIGGHPYLFVQMADVAKVNAEVLKAFGYGHCGVQATAAYCFLQEMGLQIPIEICEVPYEGSANGHQLVVIGRRPDSDPNNMQTWGEDAVVCDPWANKVYPLSHYKEMQRPENDVKQVFESTAPEHYLAGQLRCASTEICWPYGFVADAEKRLDEWRRRHPSVGAI